VDKGGVREEGWGGGGKRQTTLGISLNKFSSEKKKRKRGRGLRERDLHRIWSLKIHNKWCA